MRIPHALRAAAGVPSGPPIGESYEGGYVAGYISQTANGVATHILIVAPAATGATGTGYTLTTNKEFQTTESTTGATSTYDGAVNTPLITNSPAADFCSNLTIGGFSDWYLPARYELAIAYYNLKPTTDANSTSSGVNDYSVPKRASAYTSGNPAQTTVTSFQSGNAEAFMSSYHWTSTEQDFSTAWAVDFTNGTETTFLPDFNYKLSPNAVRAFRKVAV